MVLAQLVWTHFTDGGDFDQSPHSYIVQRKDPNKDFEYTNLSMTMKKKMANPLKSKADHFVKEMPFVYYVYGKDTFMKKGCRYIKFSKTIEYGLVSRQFKYDETGQYSNLHDIDSIMRCYRRWCITHKIFTKEEVAESLDNFNRKY